MSVSAYLFGRELGIQLRSVVSSSGPVEFWLKLTAAAPQLLTGVRWQQKQAPNMTCSSGASAESHWSVWTPKPVGDRDVATLRVSTSLSNFMHALWEAHWTWNCHTPICSPTLPMSSKCLSFYSSNSVCPAPAENTQGPLKTGNIDWHLSSRTTFHRWIRQILYSLWAENPINEIHKVIKWLWKASSVSSNVLVSFRVSEESSLGQPKNFDPVWK